MLAFYATLIVFSILSVVTTTCWLYLLTKKKSNALSNLVLLVLLTICSVIVALFGYDYIQLQRGNTFSDGGQCVTKFIRGGTSVDATKITLNGQSYTIKSDEYKDLPNGTYECVIEYLPLTKYISDVKFVEQ